MKHLAAVVLVSTFAFSSFGGPNTLNYQGRLYDTLGYPIDSGSVSLVAQVLDANKVCLLYEESRTINMDGTQGFFAISLGEGVQNTSTAPNLTLPAVISNASTLADPNMNCPTNSYTPTSADARYLRVFIDGEALTPDHKVEAAPFSLYANDAMSVGGKSLSQIEAYSDANFGGTALPDLSSISSGESVRWSGSGWELFTPGTSTVTPGIGLDVSGSDFIVRAGTNITVNASGVHVNTTNLDADQLDGQEGAYYRNFANLTNVPTGLADGDDDTTYANATTSVAGLMSAADKTKVDAIESGATGDQTAGEILTAISSVDGASSGLDADLLDGANTSAAASNSTVVLRDPSGHVYANYFNTTSDVTTSAPSHVMVETGSDSFIRKQTLAQLMTNVAADGISGDKVHGGTISVFSSTGIDDNASTTAMTIDSAGNVGIGTAGPSQKLEVNGTVLANAFLYTSDARKKENVKTVKQALKTLMKLRGVTFDWIKSGEADMGLIAQEVEAVLPDLVKTDAKSGFKSVKYANLVGVLIEAIKELEAEQAAQIRNLQEENLVLHQRLERLEKLVEKMSK